MFKKLLDQLRSGKHTSADLTLYAPCAGQYLALSDVKDQVFSSGMLGKGFAVVPSSNVITAPIQAKVTSIFATGHALTLQADTAEILIHIGIDTVKLNGVGFESLVKQDAMVEQGQPLVKIDLEAIKAAGYDPSVIVIVCNPTEFKELSFQPVQAVTASDAVMSLHK